MLRGRDGRFDFLSFLRSANESVDGRFLLLLNGLSFLATSERDEGLKAVGSGESENAWLTRVSKFDILRKFAKHLGGTLMRCKQLKTRWLETEIGDRLKRC